MPDSQETIDKMAVEMFELDRVIAASRSRKPAGPDTVSDTEFVTLDLLTKQETLTIGEIQKRIGVLPAQMSRIVRALEEQGGRGFVECKINAQDRRRIDVYITDAGKKAHQKFRTARFGSMQEILQVLKPDDRMNFMRILGEIRKAFTERVNNE